MHRPVFLTIQLSCFLIHGFCEALSSNETLIKEVNKTLVSENIFHPDIIPEGSLGLLKIVYRQKEVFPGDELHCFLVRRSPDVSWPCEEGFLYSLVVIGPDAPSTTSREQSEYQHWIKVNIPQCDPLNGTLLTAYVPDVPNYRVGLHRMIFMAFKQPSTEPMDFDEEFLPRRPIGLKRIQFSTKKFSKKYNLGLPVAANFYWMNVAVKMPDIGVSQIDL